MRFIGSIIEKLQRHPKRIVFPEGEEPRILQAARQYQLLQLGAPILLGDRSRIKTIAAELGISLQGIRVINPENSPDLEEFCVRFAHLRRLEGTPMETVREVITQPNYFGAMMVAMHQAEGIVSGTSEISGSVLRPFFRVIQLAPRKKTASSCLILELEDTRFGENGVLFMGDCGVIPTPTIEQLADIAVSTAHLAHHLNGSRPKVALLSYSTKGSAEDRNVAPIRAAKILAQFQAKELGLAADFDGEMQVDTAIIPEVAAIKLPDSPVAGQANVLIFPDLNSGNIASKMVRYAARANAYGQILLGLDRPAADVSRGSNAHDVLGVATVVGMQSIAYEKLFPGAGTRLPGETVPG